MAAICSCCGNEITGESCDYCGMIVPSTTFMRGEPENNPLLKTYAEKYRNSRLESLRNFSVTADVFRIDKEKGRIPDSGINLFENTGDGRSFRNNIVWSEEWIANPDALGITGVPARVSVSYELNGVRKESVFTLTCRSAEGVECHLGLMIDDSMQLNLLLGSEEKILAHDRVKLEWINR